MKSGTEAFKAWLESEHSDASEQLAYLVDSGASGLQSYTPRIRRSDLECCLVYLAEFQRGAVGLGQAQEAKRDDQGVPADPAKVS